MIANFSVFQVTLSYSVYLEFLPWLFLCLFCHLVCLACLVCSVHFVSVSVGVLFELFGISALVVPLFVLSTSFVWCVLSVWYIFSVRYILFVFIAAVSWALWLVFCG